MKWGKKEKIFQPALKFKNLSQQKINQKDLANFFPNYITETTIIKIGIFQENLYKLIIMFIKIMIKTFLKPRKETVGSLDKNEVEKVYKREAETYNLKHHLTTRGMDTQWRRSAANCAVDYSISKQKKLINLLDICTGTGLTIKEIVSQLNSWKINAHITGLDYSEDMLQQTKIIHSSSKKDTIKFVRGDATNMSGNQTNKNFTNFSVNSFDVAIQMFGIGGIDKPLIVFKEVLKILIKGGHYYLADMHKPITNQSGEWPFLTKWLKFPCFEMMCYEQVTIPLALNLLWGWRDTTILFYLIRLITIKDLQDHQFYGFKIISFEYNPQRWWLAMPIMSMAKCVFEKVQISQEEHLKRKEILSSVIR